MKLSQPKEPGAMYNAFMKKKAKKMKMPKGGLLRKGGVPIALAKSKKKKMKTKKKMSLQGFAMSKPVGKVLDSKAGKAGVAVGNAVKKGLAAPFKWAGRQVEKEMRMNKAKDNRYREEGERMNREYSFKSKKKKMKSKKKCGMKHKHTAKC